MNPDPVSSRLCSGCFLASAVLSLAIAVASEYVAAAGQLTAGVAKVVINNPDVPTVNDPLYVKALVLGDGATTLAIITLDVVAIGEIGSIKNTYLETVRSQLAQELNIRPAHVMVNASHCHGLVCSDVEQRTVQAVREAHRRMVPVTVGCGKGREDRIMQNRRLNLKGGGEVDVRHRYSHPPDADVVGVGPVDPQIGLLRINRLDGRTLAVVYNFACHPIMGLPNGENTADFPGFASKVVESNLDEGTMAFFIQGCAGDINPVAYKDPSTPRSAEPLGNLLGLSVLQAVRSIRTSSDAPLIVLQDKLALPRADHSRRIAALQAEQTRLVQSLQGTTLDLKSFVPLWIKHQLDKDYPSQPSYRYLHEEMMGRKDLKLLDEANQKNLDLYIQNIRTMEALTRNQVNLALLTKHHATNQAAGSKTIDVEVQALRIGDFVLVTFPGELSVEIGIHIKRASPHPNTFVAGYSNGYLYYTPTARQAGNTGAAQEDCECLVAPEWQEIFQAKVSQMLKKL